MSDELQNHMNKGMYGTPQINPDERRKYLGTFRERVDVVITFEELNNPESLLDLSQEMSIHPDFRLIINGQVDAASFPNWSSLQMITALISLQRPITVSRMIQPISRLFLRQDSSHSQRKIDIFECYPKKTENSSQPKHRSLLERLFD